MPSSRLLRNLLNVPAQLPTRAGVNALDARPRRRVCAGASMNSICFTITCAIGFSETAHRVELFGSGRAIRGEIVQHLSTSA